MLTGGSDGTARRRLASDQTASGAPDGEAALGADGPLGSADDGGPLDLPPFTPPTDSSSAPSRARQGGARNAALAPGPGHSAKPAERPGRLASGPHPAAGDPAIRRRRPPTRSKVCSTPWTTPSIRSSAAATSPSWTTSQAARHRPSAASSQADPLARDSCPSVLGMAGPCLLLMLMLMLMWRMLPPRR